MEAEDTKRISFYAFTLLFELSRFRTSPLLSMESMSVCSPIKAKWFLCALPAVRYHIINLHPAPPPQKKIRFLSFFSEIQNKQRLFSEQPYLLAICNECALYFLWGIYAIYHYYLHKL